MYFSLNESKKKITRQYLKKIQGTHPNKIIKDPYLKKIQGTGCKFFINSA